MADETLEDRIRSRAFQIWLDEGEPEGRDVEHWERAKKEITEGAQPHSGAPPLQPEPIGEVKAAQLQAAEKTNE